MFGFFDYDRLGHKAEKYKEMYHCNTPFPHIVIDDVADAFLLQKVEGSFLDTGEKWHRYDNHFEKKLAMDSVGKMPHMAQTLVTEMNAGPFVSFLEHITGKSGLIPDPGLRGAGMHRIIRGGKLDVHADFNWHPKLKLNRTINVLLYLNSNWQAEWGGQLELWDKDVTHCVKSISPVFNRMVIFTSSDDSYHGHPKPLACPEHRSRRSIAMYYYQSPVETKDGAHSTMFKKLPQDETSEDIEAFRLKRATFRESQK